jgi:hypothetical protein
VAFSYTYSKLTAFEKCALQHQQTTLLKRRPRCGTSCPLQEKVKSVALRDIECQQISRNPSCPAVHPSSAR